MGWDVIFPYIYVNIQSVVFKTQVQSKVWSCLLNIIISYWEPVPGPCMLAKGAYPEEIPGLFCLGLRSCVAHKMSYNHNVVSLSP